MEWKAPADDGGSKITGYILEKKKKGADKWVKVIETKEYETLHKVTDMEENVGFYFQVIAINKAGKSEPCEADGLVTPKKPAGQLHL